MNQRIFCGSRLFRKSFHIFLVVSILFSFPPYKTALAANHIDEFTPDPLGAGVYSTVVETGTASSGMKYTFTGDGDGGDFGIFNDAGDDNLQPKSYTDNTGTTETILIETRDGTAFDFNSIFIDINSFTYGTGFTISGVGPEPFTITTSAPGTAATYSPSDGSKLVTQVIISSVDFYNDFIDTVNVNFDVPGMKIEGNATLIINGDSTPSTSDDTDLGGSPTGTPVTSTFTITNIGDATLNLTNSPYVTLSGSADFSISSQPASGSISPTNTGTFTVQCTPSSTGVRTATVSIINNSEASPYTFSVQCTGEADITPPVLNSITQYTPATSPTNSDSLIFRASFNESVQNVSTDDFVVNSTSTATVTGISSSGANAYITVSGGDLADFNGTVGLNLSGTQNITDLSGNALPAGEPSTDETYLLDNNAPDITSFTRQTPTSSPTNADTLVFRAAFTEDVENVGVTDFSINGTTTATISGVSPVSASVFDITISGGDLAGFNGTVGLNLAGTQDIDDLAGNALPSGEPSTDETYTIDNNLPGLTSFTRQTPASSTTNADSLVFRATFTEDVQNVGTGDFSVNSITTATISGVTSVSADVYDITVSGGDLAGFNGMVGINLSGLQDITDLSGNVLPSGEPSTDETYSIDNNTPALTAFARQTPATSPTNADNLVFRASFDEDVQNAGTADFSVNSTTTATISDVTPVSSSIYDITISGGDLADFNGTVGLNLSGSQDISDLSGNALPPGEPSTDEIYTLDNDGPGVTINQASSQADPTTSTPINFTVVFDQSVSDFATGDVTLSGTASATTATVTGSGTTYNVAVSGMISDGTVIAQLLSGAATDTLGNPSLASTSTDNQVTYAMEPEIDIQRPLGNSIADGGADALNLQPTGTINLTYIVDNTAGIDVLSITNVSATNLSNASGFTLNSTLPINIAAGNSSSFDVSFTVPAAGLFSLDMDIANNDVDEGNYDININGTGYIEPEIEVSFDGTNITDGDASPSTAEGTDFGNDLVSHVSYSPQHTFTITNTGAGELFLTNSPRVTVTGTDFSLITDAPASIAPGDSATFTVQFAATAIGTRNGNISIANNDTSEDPFNFDIIGTGYSGPLMVIQGGTPLQDIENGDDTPSIQDDTEFGAVTVAGGTVSHSFRIENYGSQDLTLSGSPIVQISGANAGDFTVTAQPISPIGSGLNDTFTILFDPSATGNRTATVSIQNNDPNRDPYTFSIQGQGDDFSVMMGGNTNPTDGETLNSAPSSLLIQFTRDALADGSGNAANYINNYLLVEAGINAGFDTVSCAGGVAGDDTQINISGVNYSSIANTATVSVNSADFTSNGQYRLYVCGTTSIYDTFGNELNGGVSDTSISFIIATTTTTTASSTLSLPATGFPVGENIVLPVQSFEKRYSKANMLLEIPTLDIQLPIVGVPIVDGEWDVSWLSNEAGYLYGTAYPTWKGNTVITGHVWDAYNHPGPFFQLKNLQFGDLIKIRSGDNIYIYEVHDTRIHKANSISSVISHEEYDWLTLITCEGYQDTDQSYTYHRVIRAVLVQVVPE